jgi:hypothetical protein
MPGKWLHRFAWLEDEEIGEIPMEWNWLAGVSPDLGKTPAGIHYTNGGPWFENCQTVPYANLWLREKELLRRPSVTEATMPALRAS